MASPEITFTERWKEHLQHYKDTAKRLDEKQIQLIFFLFLRAKTKEIVLKISDWIWKGHGEDG